MCDPVSATMAALSLAGAYMQYQQGVAAADATKVTAANNAKISEYNARKNEEAGIDATRRGAQDAGTIRENARRANSELRARAAGAGLLADTGTSLDLQEQNAFTGELNALTALNNAEREAYGFREHAQSERFGAQVDTANAIYQARTQRYQGLLSAGGTLVTGAANYGKSAGWFDPKPKPKGK